MPAIRKNRLTTRLQPCGDKHRGRHQSRAEAVEKDSRKII